MIETVWNWASLSAVLPEVFMAVAGMILLIIGASLKGDSVRVVSCGVMTALAVTMMLVFKADWVETTAFSGHFITDGFSSYMKLLVLGGLFVSVALSMAFLKQEKMGRFEYPVLILLSGVGMMIMLSANSFLSLYVGLELQSLALYVLAAIRRDDARASEAGLKYFVLGALASGMLLFGISLVYGYIGSIEFDVIAATLADTASAAGKVAPGALIGMVFVIVGIAFKISAVPFHMWTPDVYEGAPTPVTALFAIVPKVAAMGLLMRLLFDPFASMMPDWQQIIWVLSAASMGLGAFAGVVQNNIKRLIAYSSIGNVGFALVGLVAGTADGAGAVILYMTLYMVMTAGLFAIVLMMRRNGMAVEKISDLSGLSKNAPVLAYAMAILMFSLSGIPPLAGFFGKLMVFQVAVAEGFYVLAVFGVLTSVVAAYYYLRIIKVMFFDDALAPFDKEPAFAKHIVIALSIAMLLGFVFIPDILIDSSQAAAAVLFATNG